MISFYRVFILFSVCFLSLNHLYALPKCSSNAAPNNWNNCVGYVDMNGFKINGKWKRGKVIYGTISTVINGSNVEYTGDIRNWEMHGVGQMKAYNKKNKVGLRYVGEIRKNAPHGEGIAKYSNGVIDEGVWKNGKFQYAKKTSFSLNSTPRKKVATTSTYSNPIVTEFKKLSLSERKKVQSGLRELRYYSSSIDGLWGKGTKSGIERFASNNEMKAELNSNTGSNRLLRLLMQQSPQTGANTINTNSHSSNMSSGNTLAGKTDSSICTLATYTKGQTTYWENSTHFKDEVKEAKRRGLSCGVGSSSQTTSYSSTSTSSGTDFNSSPSSYFNETEAKSYFKRLASFQRKAIQQVLYMDGLYRSGIDGLWGKGTSSSLKQAANIRQVNSGAEVIKDLLYEANSLGVTDSIISIEARVQQERKYNQEKARLEAKLRKQRQGAYLACYGPCIATRGFKNSLYCASRCSGLSVPDPAQNNSQGLSLSRSGMLSGEITKGLNKICYYNSVGSTIAKNVSSASICPLTYR